MAVVRTPQSLDADRGAELSAGSRLSRLGAGCSGSDRPPFEKTSGEWAEDQADRAPQQHLGDRPSTAGTEEHVRREAREDDRARRVRQRQRCLGRVVPVRRDVRRQLTERGRTSHHDADRRRRTRRPASSVAFQVPNRGCSRRAQQHGEGQPKTHRATPSSDRGRCAARSSPRGRSRAGSPGTSGTAPGRRARNPAPATSSASVRAGSRPTRPQAQRVGDGVQRAHRGAEHDHADPDADVAPARSG